MIDYLTNGLRNLTAASIIGLSSLTSIPELTSPTPILQTENLETRLKKDLELARTEPAKFVRSFEEKYSKAERSKLKKEKQLEIEIEYANMLVVNIPDPSTRLLSLYQLDTVFGHAKTLDETIEIIHDSSSTDIERLNAIEHLGFLFERKKTEKKELEEIAETLTDLLDTPGNPESKFPKYTVIQTLNTAHRFLQAEPKLKASSRLALKIYDKVQDPSTNFLSAQFGSWALDSLYRPSSVEELAQGLIKTAKVLPKKERERFANQVTTPSNLKTIWAYISQSENGVPVPPRFVYESDDYLENLWDRFEDRFSEGKEPTVEVTGLSKDENDLLTKGLEEFRSMHPDRFFTYLLATDSINFNATTRNNYAYFAEPSTNSVVFSRDRTDSMTKKPDWFNSSLTKGLMHGSTHLLSESHLGLTVGPGLLSESYVLKWMLSEHRVDPVNENFAEDLFVTSLSQNYEF